MTVMVRLLGYNFINCLDEPNEDFDLGAGEESMVHDLDPMRIDDPGAVYPTGKL